MRGLIFIRPGNWGHSVDESLKANQPKLLVVIVLYKILPQDSPAFRSLHEAIRKANLGPEAISVLLYDNTPGGNSTGPLPVGTRYEADGQNSGLAVAYNHALEAAQTEGCSWLLTLDQDSCIPLDYLQRITDVASRVEVEIQIGAIVPRMMDKGRVVSPVSLRLWGPSQMDSRLEGTTRGEIHAINSATLFRVSSLMAIGGFNPYFWLDYLDEDIFHQLYIFGFKVYVASKIQVEHSLSLLHPEELRPDRYHNILRAESAYWDLYGTPLQRFAFAARLLRRIQRQKVRGHAGAITQLTKNELRRRVCQAKAHRIAEWKSEMEDQISRSQPQYKQPSRERVRVSVCMAAYNGGQYIEIQLQSILNQLAGTDEVIVVDDASTDATREVVLSLNDSRVHLVAHDRNRGVLRTFEEAICLASGEVLFLSDQDDVWAPDKVSTVMQMLAQHPEVDVAVSDAAVIDQKGGPIAASYYATIGGFRSGVVHNMVHCRYLGCTMAFRSRILPRILPFPAGQDVLHDLWIGARNQWIGGRTLYIDRPLVSYRRHQNNATGNRRLNLASRLRIRWGLYKALLLFRPVPAMANGQMRLPERIVDHAQTKR